MPSLNYHHHLHPVDEARPTTPPSVEKKKYALFVDSSPCSITSTSSSDSGDSDSGGGYDDASNSDIGSFNNNNNRSSMSQQQQSIIDKKNEIISTKGHRRASYLHLYLQKGSVQELCDKLKDKIPMRQEPGYQHSSSRHTNRLEDESYSQLPNGTVRGLAEFLKDKIPMYTPMNHPGRYQQKTTEETTAAPQDGIVTKLSFEDLLRDQIPQLKRTTVSSLSEDALSSRRSRSVENATLSVHDLVGILQDKIVLRTPQAVLNKYNNNRHDDKTILPAQSGCCHGDCHCCEALTKLLFYLESMSETNNNNRVVIQLDNKLSDDSTRSSPDAAEADDDDDRLGTFVIPSTRSGREPRQCGIYAAAEDHHSTSKKPHNNVQPLYEHEKIDELPAKVDSDQSDKTTKQEEEEEVAYESDSSESRNDSASPLSAGEMALLEQRREQRQRLKTEYVISDAILRGAKRDPATLWSTKTSSGASPWDRSKYGNWRQQRKQTGSGTSDRNHRQSSNTVDFDLY